MKKEAIVTNPFMRNSESAAYLSISPVTLWRLCENDPDFPKKIRLSKRCTGFRRLDLDAYLELKKVG